MAMRTYCAVMPPSITSSEPVTQDDSSDARNSTPLAISRAVPSRPIGKASGVASHVVTMNEAEIKLGFRAQPQPGERREIGVVGAGGTSSSGPAATH
jgi:hypothetical protein